jgi:PPK2 family polyphosphate:nucleotide phosphotransferase
VSHALDLRPFGAGTGGRFRLRDHAPDFLPSGVTRENADAALAASVVRLRTLQERLYAESTWSLLLILQGMDASGKDSTIEHVMSGVNPQGCEVHSFKAPSDEDLAHDFLWRTTVRLPARGHVGIFNRSYYEEVLVVRVHPEMLERQRLPPERVTGKIWDQRYEDIVTHERHIERNGTVVLKIFLNVSKQEQRRRFLKRLEKPEKRWKFSTRDIEERKRWPEYMKAYEAMIRGTSTEAAPWYVVPADRKWFARAVVAALVVDALERLDLHFPTVTGEQKRELMKIRRELEANG